MGYGENVAEVITLGPAQVLVGGNDLGHTDETGAKVMQKSAVISAKVAKYGNVPVSVWLNGQPVDVEFVLMQTDFVILAAAFPGATLVTASGGGQKITWGTIAGTQIPSVSLVLAPFISSNTPTDNWKMQAVPAGDFTPVYEGGKWAGYKCKFTCVVNEAGASQGAWTGSFGDPSVTADVTAPTVTAVVPANGASGVPTSTTVVATVSKALDGTTVNTSTVQLIEDPTGTPAEIAGSVVLVNNGASTTVTFTPTSNIPSGKSYVFVMSGNIKDQAGNKLGSGAGFLSHFAT